MVLGVDWLSQFNPMPFDFKQSSIGFCYEGIEVELKCELEKEDILIVEEK